MNEANPYVRPDGCICNSLMPGLVNVDPRCPAHGKPQVTHVRETKSPPVTPSGYEPLIQAQFMLVTYLSGIDVSHCGQISKEGAESYKVLRHQRWSIAKEGVLSFALYPIAEYYQMFNRGEFELGKAR